MYLFPFVAPSPPNNVMATASSSTSINVTWSAPSISNGNITSYTVTFYETNIGSSSSNFIRTVTADTFSLHLLNLAIFTSYTISVQASTVAPSSPSTLVTVETLQDGEIIL